MAGLFVRYDNRRFDAVIEGADPQTLTPRVALNIAITVQGTMNHHSSRAVTMSLDDPFHEPDILYTAEAFIVNHHIITRRPVRIFVNAHHVTTRCPAFVDHRPLHVRPSADPLGQNPLLILIIVAASARHQQRPNRSRRIHLHTPARANAKQNKQTKHSRAHPTQR